MQLDPHKLVDLIERRLGPRLGSVLIQAVIWATALGVIGIGLKLFFGDFVAGLLWPFLSSLFGAAEEGITLDNIEAIIVTLVAAVVILVFVFVSLAIVMAKAFSRRVVPQEMIDALAEHRSRGIRILNTLPENSAALSAEERDAFVEVWRVEWTGWRQEVVQTLRTHFTKAESLSFERLGVIDEKPLNFALTAVHMHYLLQLSKQLRILEVLIQRHQERR